MNRGLKVIVIPNSFYGNLVPAIFRHRLHRFGAEVEMAGEVEIVHIPNPGGYESYFILVIGWACILKAIGRKRLYPGESDPRPGGVILIPST